MPLVGLGPHSKSTNQKPFRETALQKETQGNETDRALEGEPRTTTKRNETETVRRGGAREAKRNETKRGRLGRAASFRFAIGFFVLSAALTVVQKDSYYYSDCRRILLSAQEEHRVPELGKWCMAVEV